MNVEEIKGLVDLSIEELSMAQILFGAGKYSGSITHSYYAMFDFAKELLLTEYFTSKKHDTILKRFSKDFVRDGDFSQDIYQYYSDAKNLRKNLVMIFSANFDSKKYDCLFQAEIFITEVKILLYGIC